MVVVILVEEVQELMVEAMTVFEEETFDVAVV